MVLRSLLPVLLLALLCACATAHRYRGLNPERQPFYPAPGAPQWHCADNSAVIRGAQVNDDVCDCADGSDEPGTSACANGLFFCENEGFQPVELLSSRVDDSVCDCCDGSDERLVQCPNTCAELGRLRREQLAVERAQRTLGYSKRLELAAQGTAVRAERLERIAHLQGEVATLKEEEGALKAAQDAAEGPEREAKDSFDKQWEESTAAQQEQAEVGLFELLDVDKNGRLAVDDLTHHTRFDTDQDGIVSVEEAEIILDVDGDGALNETESSVDVGAFRASVYPNLPDEVKEEHAQAKPEYPEEIKALIAAADTARTAHREVQDKLRGLEGELSGLQRKVEVDDGPEHEWGALADSCMEMTDREYKYKLCPFDKVTQEPLHGGRSTSLGTWKDWTGSPDRFSHMLFDNGERCWNGPSRSASVAVECGAENKIVSVEEPSRCEYQMKIVTPAACEPPGSHDEL